jgi:general secretion pathway protein D
MGLVVLPVRADEAEDLARAVQLFEGGQYLEAQELLTGIDRSKLSASGQATRDDYLSRVEVAITMLERSIRELDDAETAMQAANAAASPEIAQQERASARALLERVLANPYANELVLRAARAKLRDLDGGDSPAPTEPPRHEGTEPAAQPDAAPDSDQPPVEEAPASTITEVDTDRARTLTAEADAMVATGRYDEAERLYVAALSAVPGYPEAVAGLDRVQMHRENTEGSRGDSIIEATRARYEINWQRTAAHYRDTERSIRSMVGDNKYDEAHQAIERARQIVESGRQFADPVSKFESLRSELDALAEYVRESERVFNEQRVAELRRQVEDTRRANMQQIEENRSRQIDALMRQANQHSKDREFKKAINVLRQVTVIDPTYEQARWMMDQLEETLSYVRQRQVRDDQERQTVGVLTDLEESKIPWWETLRYPDDWPEMMSRPTRRPPGAEVQDSLLFGALDQMIPVDFQRKPFGEVIEMLADAHQINLLVNWNDLEVVGVSRDVPIDLSLPNEITLKKAITEVLDQAGAGVVDLGYQVADGVITVASQDWLNHKTYAAVYDVNDLLMEVPMFADAPTTDLSRIRPHERLSEYADNPWSKGDDDDDDPEIDPRREERVEQIIGTIVGTIQPDSWRRSGGSIGVIKEINGQLVVTQNSAAHGHVGALLEKLREQRSLQIGVEARFLIVSSHYLEEMGLDIDIVLNNGNAGLDFLSTGDSSSPVARDPVLGSNLLMPRSFSRLGFTPAVPAIGTANALPLGAPNNAFTSPGFVPAQTGSSRQHVTPVPIQNSVLGYTDPSRIAHDISGTLAGNTVGPALQIFGSFLDNIQVDFLVRATQADSRNSVLTAPRLVLFNGQRSWVAVTVQTNFVSSLTPVVNVAAAAQLPVTGTINAGAVLDVQAVVTADKRYVTMTLRPGVTRLAALDQFQTSGGGTAGDAFVQLPTLSAQQIKTTVSVPDGGTLLIGGQKLSAETEIEAGVPILSKIPILKRAYSSRSMVKDEQTLLILIKPTIFIMPEQEALAFPGFSNEGG